MKDINTITVSGTVAKTPDLKHVGAGGIAMLTFRLYAQREYSYNGQAKTDNSYFDIKVWGDYAAEVAMDMDEGHHVTLQGRLTQESWEDKSTKKRMYRVMIIAETVVNNDKLLKPIAVHAADAEVQQRAKETPAAPKARPPAFDATPLDVKATTVSVLEDESIDDIPF